MGDFDTTGHCPKCNLRWFKCMALDTEMHYVCQHCGHTTIKPYAEATQ